jgi:hypothetical protein
MMGCSENWRGSRPYRSVPVLERSNWLHSFTRKSRGHFVCLQSARGLAQSRTLRVFQESSCCAQRLGVSTLRNTATEDGRRPSAAFPRGISNCANLTGTAIVFPDRQSYTSHTLAKWHKKNISGDSCISWFKAFPSSIFHPPSLMLPSCISGRSPSSASACSAAPSGWPSDAGNSRA